jgi:hypothetical protein
VNFNTAQVTTETITPLLFGDQPVSREVLSVTAAQLPTVYASASATITLGYESDVAPRPNGSNTGTITIADWTLIGRLTSGLEPIEPGSEFQRADCAPRNTLGNGSLTLSDWVQAGRYAAGLDPILPAGGPTGPPTAAPTVESANGLVSEGKVAGKPLGKSKSGANSENDDQVLPSTVISLIDGGSNNQIKSVSIEVDSLGSENALSLSLSFDPTRLTYLSAESSDQLEDATLNINDNEALQGQVGIAIALPAGTSLVPGTHRIVTLKFTNAPDANEATVNFADQPIAREVVDVNANQLRAIYLEPVAWQKNSMNVVPFFMVQHFSHLLNFPLPADRSEHHGPGAHLSLSQGWSNPRSGAGLWIFAHSLAALILPPG